MLKSSKQRRIAYLTPIQRKCLTLRAQGLRYKEIAQECHLGYADAVHKELSKATYALRAESYWEAIYLWVHHPDRDNEVLWDVVDILREETRLRYGE